VTVSIGGTGGVDDNTSAHTIPAHSSRVGHIGIGVSPGGGIISRSCVDLR
jgi:hypothetical protein